MDPAAKPDRRALVRLWLERGAALLASFCFALSFGLHYGESNQNTYLLLSKRVLDPELYTRDWLAADTVHYHVTFRYLGALLIAFSERGMGVAVGQALAMTAGTYAVYLLLSALLRPGRALVAFFAVLAIAFVTRTSSVAATYVFDHTLQPSTLGSVGLLFAAAFFAQGRYLYAGLGVAFSGLFHTNYLLLQLVALGVAQLWLGREGFVKRGVQLFAAPLAVLALFVPMILSSAGGGPEAAEAQEFYMRVRGPHHFSLSRGEAGFAASLSWVVLGLGVGVPLLGRRPELRRLLAFVAGLLTIISLGIVFSSLFPIRQANMLFAWRILPHVELVSQALLCAGLVELALDPRRRALAAGPAAFGSLLFGLAVLSMFGAFHKRASYAHIALALTMGTLVFASLLGGLELLERWIGSRPRELARRAAPWVLGLVGAAGVVQHSVDRIPEALKRSTVLKGGDAATSELCGWIRANTAKSALFLTPPSHESFRFRCERSIVVDWKSPPIMPKELLEWRVRLEAVTGRKKLSGSGDLKAYDSMDRKRLEALKARYGVDYVVLRGRRGIDGVPVAFQGRGFTVLDARSLAVDAALDDAQGPAPDLDVNPPDVLPDDAKEDGVEAE